MESLTFGTRAVGPGHPPYVIAEIGSNHNGDTQLCIELIDAAVRSGADAVKFQSWTDTSLIAEEEYERNTVYPDKKRHFGALREMVKAYQFTPEQHRAAQAHCRAQGIAFCSTPFSPAEVDLLEELDVPFFKIASMDLNHLTLLDYAARKGRPMLLSTGMATLGEIETALETVRQAGNRLVALLHCVSIYPPDYGIIHLRNIVSLSQIFDVPVGFSDHTLGTAVSLAAVALGACVLEKHFTLNKDLDGWDHEISADPVELRSIVQESKNVFVALGSLTREVSPAELEKRRKFRRSLVARSALDRGHVLTTADLDAKRPGTGIPPDELSYVLGRSLARDLRPDQVLHWQDLQ